jgi:hypothetical protein
MFTQIFRFLISFFAATFGMIILLPFIIISIPIIIFVITFRVFIKFLEPRFIPKESLFVFDDNVGWKPKSNLNTYYKAEMDVFHTLTGNDGWIGCNDFRKCDIIIFGDSFAFGYGIDLRKSFLCLNKNMKIKSISAPGYNMVQELILMQQYEFDLHNKLILWFVYLENDLHDNLTPTGTNLKRMPFVRISRDTNKWEIVKEHLDISRWKHGNRRREYSSFLLQICSPGSQISKRAFSACDFLIKEATTLCKRTNATLIFITIPYLYQLPSLFQNFAEEHGFTSTQKLDPDYPDKYLKFLCDKHDIQFYALKDILDKDDYNQFEQVHWSEKGHKKVSDYLNNLLCQHKQKS